ncbi:MAG TPA: hypothetical protein VGS28_01025 [Candidatus Saccharimonadales bacterium]|nr:hypothetical protein [Candidatus Saccharimonadales bacterium]
MGRRERDEDPERLLAQYERDFGNQMLNKRFGWLALNGLVAIGLVGSREDIYGLIGNGIPQQIGLWAVTAGLLANLVRMGFKSRREAMESAVNYYTVEEQGRQRGPEGEPGDGIPRGPDQQ